MAVKDGLPATDFSKMNRDYIRNVAEGETVKDGLPATDFSRMNREYIKAVVEESGGGGSSDFSIAEVTITNTTNDGAVVFPCIGADHGDGIEDWDTMEIMTVEPSPDGQAFKIPVYKSGTLLMVAGNPPYTISVTGSITEDSGTIIVTGNGTISMS